MKFNMDDKKIIELEEKIAYLQNMLDDMNMTVYRQHERIEKLSKIVKEININNSKNINKEEDSSDKDKPPHY